MTCVGIHCLTSVAHTLGYWDLKLKAAFFLWRVPLWLQCSTFPQGAAPLTKQSLAKATQDHHTRKKIDFYFFFTHLIHCCKKLFKCFSFSLLLLPLWEKKCKARINSQYRRRDNFHRCSPLGIQSCINISMLYKLKNKYNYVSKYTWPIKQEIEKIPQKVAFLSR